MITDGKFTVDGMEHKLRNIFVFGDTVKWEKQERDCLEKLFCQARQHNIRIWRAEKCGLEEAFAELKKQNKASLAVVSDRCTLKRVKELSAATLYFLKKDESVFGADMAVESFQEITVMFLQKVFCRHHRIPWTVLKTKQCILREAVPEDLCSFYDIYRQPSVEPWVEPMSEDFAKEQERLKSYIQTQYVFYDYGTWTIIDKDTGAVIGRCGLEPGKDGVQMGYLIREEYRCRGIAREVCSAVLTYAADELQLPEIKLYIDPANTASVLFAQSIGFHWYDSYVQGSMPVDVYMKTLLF